MPGNDRLVSIRDLSFRYPKTLSGREGTPLRNISLTFPAGEFTVITGPSGSGKSTLARCFNGLIPHATEGTMEGDVIVRGMNTREHSVTDFAPLVGMVFQDPGYQLVTGDVENEIAFGPEIQELPEAEIRARISETASLLRIGHLLKRAIGDLSWGERQRVAIASVLAVRPRVLVMDEPFSGLDAAAARSLAGLLDNLKRTAGTTVVVFEHRTAGLLPFTDRLIVMDDGTVVYDGKPDGDALPGRERRDGDADPAGGTVPSGNPPPPSTGPTHAPSLSLRDVAYRFTAKTDPVLSGITVDFFPGEVTILAGANGTGKTTLLKHCNGLIRPDCGCVFLGTDPLAGMTVAAAARTVGLLTQHADYQLFGSTITEELAFGPRNLGIPEDRHGGLIDRTRGLCMLSHIDPSTPPLGLSGGEKQRVALAGILSMETPVVILDEPTFGLDAGLKGSLGKLLRGLAGAGRTVIVATHDEEFALACGDRFVRIAGGRVESDYRQPPGSRPGRSPSGVPGEQGGGVDG